MNFMAQKKYRLLFILLTLKSVAFPQAFQKKDIVLSASVGLPHLRKTETYLQTKRAAFKESFNGDVESSVKGINPILLKYEYAIAKNFSLGASFAWYNIKILVKDSYVYNGTSIIDNYTYKVRSGSLGIRPNYHWPIKKIKSDFFVGSALGITINSVRVDIERHAGTTQLGFANIKLPRGLYAAATFGYRYYFSEDFCFNIEAGYERGALLQLGLAHTSRPFRYEPR